VLDGESGEFGGTDRFEIGRRLGAGGMGVVYEALDRERNVRVALKTLRSLDAEALFRLKNEFHALQDLQHPNLVSLGELVCEGDRWFFTMELLEGCSFLAFVRGQPDVSGHEDTGQARGALDPEPAPSPHACDERRLRDATAQLARGLHALHGAGKVHRDVKPSNVLVTGEGRVVLLDFGLATALPNALQTSEAIIVGTADYMAPEQAASKTVGPEADWYSVGVMLYEALTGRLPFTGQTLEVLMNKQRLAPPSPLELVPSLPKDLAALVEELLRFDPAARPSGREILRRFDVAVGPTSSHTVAPVFVGRKAELKLLGDAFDKSRGGAATVVRIDGESGVGKSALVRHFLESLAARRPDLVVLAGRCHERESVPFKALDGVVDALSRYMRKLSQADAAALLPRRAALLPLAFQVLGRVEVFARALAPLEILDPHQLRSRAFEALRELFSRLAERCPLVVVIDDLQWADADSATLLDELLRPPDAPAFLLIVTARSSADGGGTSRFISATLSSELRHIHLDRLPPESALELARALLQGVRPGVDPGADAEAVAREADGHPMFIDELVRQVALRGELESAPPRLEEVLWSRIAELDPPARTLLEVVSVAGVPLDQEIAARAAALEPEVFSRQMSLLRVAHLVRTAGARGTDTVEVFHDRVRSAVLAHLDAEDRRQVHERLAFAFQTSGRTDPEVLAVHWREAGDALRAASYSALAAEAAARALAFDRAARLYRQAIELSPEAAPERRGLGVKLGEVLVNAGRGAEAAREFLAAVVGANAAEALELQRRAAEHLLLSGHIDEGMAVLDQVLGAVGMRLPPTPRHAQLLVLWNRARLRLRGLGFEQRDESQIAAKDLQLIDVCWSASIGLSAVDTIRGQAFTSRHIRLALDMGEPYRVARALAFEGGTEAWTGRSRRGRVNELFADAEALAGAVARPHVNALIPMLRGGACYFLGEFKEGLGHCERAEQLLRERCTGVAWELGTTQLYNMMCMHYLGELGRMREKADLAIWEAESRGDLYAQTSFRGRILPYVLLAADRPSEARRELTLAMKGWPAGVYIQHLVELLADASIDLYCGDGASAYRRVLDRWRAIQRVFLLRMQLLLLNMLYVRGRSALAAALQASGREPLLKSAERDARLIEREATTWATPWAKLLRAGVAQLRGDAEGAARMLATAAADFDAADMALHAAASRLRRGQLIGGDEGQALVREAESWMKSKSIRNPDRTAAIMVAGF
jgi:tetratricopeptide (TPR) repeat protein